MNKDSLFAQIKDIVKTIPQGKVVTYGDVAKFVGITDTRKVEWALHGNENPEIPCHRVVKKDGFIAERFSSGGGKRQQELLKNEDVAFIKNMQVNMKECHFILQSQKP